MSDAIIGLAVKTVSQAAYANSSLVSAGPTTVYGISGYNSGPAQFVQIHDAATLPADTAVPKFNISVAATANYSIDFGVYGMEFANGVVVCNSTTAPTKTIGAADTQFFSRVRTR